jgi:ATP-binding cassette subfamily F protein uup
MLARSLAKPSNVLVLDEPTNDLDLETLDVLDEMLGDYAGTVLLISHDRDFLDRVVDTVIVPEGDGKWLAYAGGYTDMLTQRGEDVRRKSVKPAEKAAAGAAAGGKAAAPAEAGPQRAAAPTKRKLSFNEKHALETLPARIAELETEIRRLQAVLADTTLYARDRAAFDRASSAIAAKQAELAAAEERWLELELLRDEIEKA